MDNKVIETIQEEVNNLKDSIQPILDKVSALEAVLKLYKNGHSKNGNKKNEKAPLEQPGIDFGSDDAAATNSFSYGELNAKILKFITDRGAVVKSPVIAEHVYGKVRTPNQNNSISGALITLRKNGKLERYKEDNNNSKTFWGLKDWFDGETPKAEYK